MSELYNKVSFNISKLVTQTYSTSFSLAISHLNPEMRQAIYSIYGFVRLADEIVDTFHQYDKESLLKKFESDYYEAYNHNISLNPVLHAFQQTVKKYRIPDDLVHAFLKSMKYDLTEKDFSDDARINDYIYGSAEVVGLMCLKVFTNADENMYNELHFPAKKLGSAFQKVNFLRDIKNDMEYLSRNYFPVKTITEFDEPTKHDIIQDIHNDFHLSFEGIKKLPHEAKLPVLTAYYYYQGLLTKIADTPAHEIINKRIRINNFKKLLLFIKAKVYCKLRLV